MMELQRTPDIAVAAEEGSECRYRILTSVRFVRS